MSPWVCVASCWNDERGSLKSAAAGDQDGFSSEFPGGTTSIPTQSIMPILAWHRSPSSCRTVKLSWTPSGTT
jgi:hypothetical protein